MADALRPVEAMHYGDGEPTSEQVEALSVLRTALEFAVRRRMNGVVYVLWRRVLLPRFSFRTYRYA
ncbi:MAG: hypothetical protein IJ518_04560 [Clostridia bacterium]|nr:hypothetical protein [Clostridia bacterium]